MKIDATKRLPFWWMAAVELGLFAAAAHFLYSGQYADALLAVILIELRDVAWQLKSK
jgi:hypothetical protein